MQIHQLSATELAAAVRDGQLRPTEVLEHTLRRAEELGPVVGAFSALTPEHAQRQALVAEELIDATPFDDLLPPLLGVPCPIKDMAAVEGLPFEGGSLALRGLRALHTDGIATLLAHAGSLMIGKTATPEFGLSCYTEPEGLPPARTPWDLTRGAGGSSGGAAAAVAAGIVPIAQGSDGGGSIRIPASCCGLVGLKPSRGLVSPGPHGVDGIGLAVAGVLTRTVLDTALGLDVLARPRPGDWFTSSSPDGGFVAALSAPLPILRIGLLTTPVIAMDAPVHAEAIAAAERAARLLEALGHKVSLAPVPFAAQRWSAFRALWSVGPLGVDLTEEQEAQLRPLTRWLRAQGRDESALEYSRAHAAIQILTRHVAEAWAEFDVIVTPTLAQPPAPIGSLRNDADPEQDFADQTAFTPWTSIYNITGRPAISLPLHRAALDADDSDCPELPFGVMLGAAHGGDALLLALSQRLYEVDPWPTRPRL